MKKIFTFALLFAVVSAYAAVGVTPAAPGIPNASQIMIPFGKGHVITLMELSKMSIKEYEEQSGKKLGFFKRLSFKMAQKKLANSIDDNGTITNTKLLKAFSSEDHSTGFHLGGFALGFLLGLIGVLIAYLINDDVKANRRKWSWIGLIGAILLGVIFIL